MDYNYKTIQIDEDTRIQIDYDTDRYEFGDAIGDMFGVQTLDIARNYNDISTDDDVKHAIERFRDTYNYFSHPTNYRELRERAISLWLWTTDYDFKFVSLRGYSQGEWADVLIYQKKEYEVDLDEGAKTLDSWFAGDVFIARHQTRKVYTAEDGDTIDQWETDDAIGGLVGDDGIENLSRALLGV